MTYWFVRIVAFLVIVLAIPTAGQAQKRVALLIGNSSYGHVEKLKNPINDAAMLAGKLKAIGFDKVTLKQDLTANGLRLALGQFARDAAGADIAVVYFAGHGIEVGGTNYVIPTDAKLTHVDDVDFEAVRLDTMMRALNRASKLKLVILDACRNNPFKSNMSGTSTNRSVGRGLARVNPSGSDTLVAYAAKEGTVAADGEGKHSPYAQALIRHIATPDLDIRRLFGRVRDDVLKATGGKQEPYTYGSLSGEKLVLAERTADADQSEEASNTPSPSTEPTHTEALYWESVKDSKNASAFRAFLDQFPSGVFSELAKIKLEELKSNSSASSSQNQPAPKPTQKRKQASIPTEKWKSGFGQGICEAFVKKGPGNQIYVSCECGSGRPSSSIRFTLAGDSPPPRSTVTLTFDNEDPQDLSIDRNGEIGSNCRACAGNFDFAIERLKKHSSVYVRFQDGSGTRFSLNGAAAAIGDCKADFWNAAIQ